MQNSENAAAYLVTIFIICLTFFLVKTIIAASDGEYIFSSPPQNAVAKPCQKPAWESKPKGGCSRVLVQLCSTVCVRENHKISANGQKRLIQNLPAVLCRKPSPGISRHFIFAEEAHTHIVDHTLST